MSREFTRMHNEYLDPDRHSGPVLQRVYHTSKGVLEIVKEWNWAPKSYVWFVQPSGDQYPKVPLGKFSSFAEAKQFIREIQKKSSA